MATRIQIRRDTSTNWENNNPVLALGEPGLETDTLIVKYGDGSSTWNSLPYANIDSLADFTTTNLAEGSNLYYTNARVYANIVNAGFVSGTFATNAQLASYATNNQLSLYATNSQLGSYATNNQLTLYATNAQLGSYATNNQLTLYATNAQINNLVTLNIPESGNLYFTDERVLSSVSKQTFSNVTFSGNVSGTAAIGAIFSKANSIGYLGIPQESFNTNYTIGYGDQGKHMFATANITFTIPDNASLSLPIGTSISFISNASCTANIAITGDVMYLSNVGSTGTRTLTQFGQATALKVANTIWFISGVGLS
jgi:hypothetical protein